MGIIIGIATISISQHVLMEKNIFLTFECVIIRLLNIRMHQAELWVHQQKTNYCNTIFLQ